MNSDPCSQAPTPAQLTELFFPPGDAPSEFKAVEAGELPDWYAILLHHDQHMTLTLEAFHRCRVDVEVVAKQTTAEHYTRMIVLRRRSDGAVVQFGVVRILLDALEDDVRREIESEKTPLGTILIRRNLLRQVRLCRLWRVAPTGELARLLEAGDSTYGRTAIIELERRPAIELLEIVTRTGR